MEQAVSAFGIPKSELRDAKRQGCDGFRNSRVQMDEVCRWIFSRRRDAQRTDGIGSLEDEQARQAKWRADLLELETREKEGELVNLSEVQVMQAKAVGVADRMRHQGESIGSGAREGGFANLGGFGAFQDQGGGGRGGGSETGETNEEGEE